MLAKVYSVMVIISFISAGISGNMEETSNAVLSSCKDAVQLSISLLGIMCLWSGIIRVFDKANITFYLSKLISPILKLIYPKAYKYKTAIQSISANYSANFLGLGNAALPLGIKAMEELKKTGLKHEISANDEMIMFAVLNTVPFQAIPTTLIALRTTYMSQNPFEIILPIWVSSVLTTIFGIILCKFFAKVTK